jgi:hypothetical protein
MNIKTRLKHNAAERRALRWHQIMRRWTDWFKRTWAVGSGIVFTLWLFKWAMHLF